MERTTLYRFSKLSGIPILQLDPVLLSVQFGATKDPVAVYKALKRDQLIRNAAKASGKSLQDVLRWLEQP